MYVSYADEYGTEVEYVVSNQSEYSITVPAKLTPKTGQSVSGTVNLNGRWPSNEVVKITFDESVVLKNSLNPSDTRELDITLTDMSYAGNDTSEKTYTGTVTIEPMSSDVLFGIWTGKFNYNVEFDDGKAEMIEFSIYSINEEVGHTFTAEAGMTWGEWIESDYNTKSYYSNQYKDSTVWCIVGGIIDSNNNFIHLDTVIDPFARYELWNPNDGSYTFGETAPTCPWV